MKFSLIEFSVENFKIFKDKVTFSMGGRKNENVTFESNGEDLLKTTLIFGPNASGKTTLFQAIELIRQGIKKSAFIEDGDSAPYRPFLLTDEQEKPSSFEILFSLGAKIYRYSFSLLQKQIISEKLIDETSAKPKTILERSNQQIVVDHEFKSSRDVVPKTRKNTLFLSAAAQWNNILALEIYNGFDNINVIDGAKYNSLSGRFTASLIKRDPDIKKEIINLLRKADFNIVDAEINEEKIPEEYIKALQATNKNPVKTIDSIKFAHNKYNSKKEVCGVAKFDYADESGGTQHFFNILGPIIDTLNNGRVLLVDEIDTSLHPKLTEFVIDLFNNHNANDAQLIVTTHDTSLIAAKGKFTKPQVWFTSRKTTGDSELFSLEEFADLRNDTEFQKKYLEGRFGALPFVE